MSTAGQLVLVLLVASLVASGAAWTRVGHRIWTPLALVALVAAGAVAGAVTSVGLDHAATAALAALAGLLALVGGGPLTTLVFDLVDSSAPSVVAPTDPSAPPPPAPVTLTAAGAALRGGLVIGCLERLAVVVAISAGWPEGVAVVLAVKGLGRYPELRHPGAAERFIIGTFTSVLWAVGCAGVVLLAR